MHEIRLRNARVVESVTDVIKERPVSTYEVIMKQTIEHPLDTDKARKVAKKAFESYAERFAKYNPTAEWHTDHQADFGFEAKGVTLSGSLELREHAIDVEMDVPFIFKPFRKKALDVIQREINKWIEKAQAGELDDE